MTVQLEDVARVLRAIAEEEEREGDEGVYGANLDAMVHTIARSLGGSTPRSNDKWDWDAFLANNDDWYEYEEEEANYGNCDLLDQAAKAGFTFVGYHSAGGSYDASVFACYEGMLAQAYTGVEGAGYVIGFSDDGPNKDDVEGVMKYERVYSMVRRLMNRSPIEHVGAAFEKEKEE
jgi:hypothetical protein